MINAHVKHDSARDAAKVRAQWLVELALAAEDVVVGELLIGLDDAVPPHRHRARIGEDAHDVGADQEGQEDVEYGAAKVLCDDILPWQPQHVRPVRDAHDREHDKEHRRAEEA